MTTEPIVACIRGQHTLGAVATFRDRVTRFMATPHTLVCLTDRPGECDGVSFIQTGEIGLPGEWARLLLFEPSWRGHRQVIYFDLDLVIMGDLTPLTAVPGEFATTMDQSIMVIGAGKAGFVWVGFSQQQERIMGSMGARATITAFCPRSTTLRRQLPDGFITRGCVGVR